MNKEAPDNPLTNSMDENTPKQAPFPLPKGLNNNSNDYFKGVLNKGLPSDPTAIPASGKPPSGYSSEPGNTYNGGQKKISRDELEDRESQPQEKNEADSEKESLGLKNTTPVGLRKSGKSTHAKMGDPDFGYKQEHPTKSTYAKIRGRLNKRSVTGIAVAGVLSVTGIGFFSFASGPLTIIHLGELLNLPGRTQNQTNNIRMGAMYRYIRTGDFGETRLGSLESKMNKKIINDFKKEGIILKHDDNGRLTKVTVEPRENSKLKGLNAEERKAKFAETYGVTPDKVRTLGNGTLEIDSVGTKYSFKKSLVNGSFGLASKGTASTAIHNRIFLKYSGEYSLFHPMRKLEEKARERDLARITNRAEKKKARKEAARANNEKLTKLSPAAQAKVDSIKSKVGSNGFKLAAGGGIAVTGAICTIREIAGEIPDLQFVAAVMPAMAGSYAARGYASQAKSGDDLAIQQAGDFVGTLTNEAGETVFQAASLNALAGKNEGIDMDPDIKNSFSDENKAASLKSALDSIPGVNIACSPGGIIAQTILGGVILVSTGGTGTAILKIGSSAASGVLVSRVIGYLEKAVVGPSLAPKVLGGGALGGNLLAHGAMASAGMSAMNFGGVAFSSAVSEDIRTERIAEYNDEFKQESLATRIFDVQDRRSLASSVIDNGSINTKEPLSNLASILSFKSLSSGFTSLFGGEASAAERSYDWSMPEYGFSKKILDDPKYQDPYDNADKVATFIKGSDYIEKASVCFATNITKEDTGWNAVTDPDPAKMVNPATSAYHDKNCGDESDENWIRVRLFILDTKNMTGFACLEGDSSDPEILKACEDLGVGTATAPTDAQGQVVDGNTIPPEAINGYILTPKERENLKYIAEKVKPLLKGTPEEQARIAAESSWWSLREGVLNLPQPYNNVKPFAFSNCGSGDGNTPIGIVATCSASTWQVGIGAVQVPPFDDDQVISTARSLHNNDPVKDILGDVSILTGNTEGSTIYKQIIASTGILQRSLLLRDPATGITLVNGSMQPCLKTPIPPQSDWCTSGGHDELNGSPKNIKKAIEELTLYFSGGAN